MNNENYRYTIKGKCTIVETKEGMYVLKEKNSNSNIKGLYSYLKSRDFYSYANVLDDSRREVNVYEYLEDTLMPKEQKSIDLINIISMLHSKTFYFKEVREDKFKEIYESVESNIKHLENYYSNMYSGFFKEKYQAPSHYLFMRNYYKLEGALAFCKNELDSWYDVVKEEKKMRVCINHGDLTINHYIKNEKDALISWEKHCVDTPVLDLVKLYKNDLFEYNFEEVYKEYNQRISLTSYEQKLFFILITLPQKLDFDKDEFNNTIDARKFFDYIFKTEELIKPYYSKNEEKE